MTRRKWEYQGDVSLENGGYFFNRSNIEHDYVDVVRVTPCSDAGGPDNEWWVEVLTVNLPTEDAKLEFVLSTSGLSLEELDAQPQRVAEVMAIDACIAYGKYDQDGTEHVRIGPKQSVSGWDATPVDVQLRGNASLRRYVKGAFAKA